MMLSDRFGRSRGQAIPEFALVVPMLLLLFFGIIESGRFLLSYQALNNAVREGARYAIVNGSDSLCPSGPMPGGIPSASSCADPTGANIVAHVRRFGFTTQLSAVSGASLTPPCTTPGSNQVTVCWNDVDNARGHTVTVEATYTFRTIIPLPLPPINMNARSSLVINH